MGEAALALRGKAPRLGKKHCCTESMSDRQFVTHTPTKHPRSRSASRSTRKRMSAASSAGEAADAAAADAAATDAAAADAASVGASLAPPSLLLAPSMVGPPSVIAPCAHFLSLLS